MRWHETWMRPQADGLRFRLVTLGPRRRRRLEYLFAGIEPYSCYRDRRRYDHGQEIQEIDGQAATLG